ncbi:extensin family protein [Kaistia granuli]|uniref:extensin-like domain-containing protein n=1 Tax=Kaistia granuli TaxID=363259 RepID=UPI00037104AD|nr:extensin family protein [Kaistia granuli]
MLAAFLVTAMPIEARAISPDELFQKIIPKVDPGSERKPAKRRTQRATPAAPQAKAALPEGAKSDASPAMPLPARRPDAAAEPPVAAVAVPVTPAPVVADRPATPLPRSKPESERKAAGLVAIPPPADAAVEKVTTETVPADPALAAGAAAALAGAVPADPPTAEQLAFAPPVLPSALKPAPGEAGGRNTDGSLKKSDRLPPPQKEAAIASPEAAATAGEGPLDEVGRAPANLPAPLPTPRRKPEIVMAAMIPTVTPALPEGLAACRASMASMKISAKALPAIQSGSCGGPDPFDVSELEGGAIDLSPAAKVNCAVATTLARWIEEDIQPSAQALLGGRVTGLRIADSYSCRGRNRVANAQLSEHAFLNAVDIGAFEIGGRWVTVTKAKDRTEKEDSFLKAARVSACDKFMTVLGPGSDGYHEDHYHLDLRQRGKGAGKKYCH